MRKFIITTLRVSLLSLFLFILPNTASSAGFDDGYTYCRPMTMTAGGTSGGVATTTTSGFPLVATSTIADLKHADHGGKIELFNTASTTPTDVMITNGTDCNSDPGTTIDFFFESYASTTGAFVLWAQAPDISSTTAKTLLMYYGNGSATDQSNERAVFDAQGEAGVWTLGHDGVATTTVPDFRDSSPNTNDGTSQNMNSTNLVDGQMDGALDFDGIDDNVTVNDSSSLDITGALTISTWIYINDNVSARFWSSVNKNEGACGSRSYRMEIGVNNGSDTVSMHIYNDLCGSAVSASVNNVITANTWTHIVGVYQPSDFIRLYVNGALSAENISSIPASIADSSSNLVLGEIVSGQLQAYTGRIDDVRVYNRGIHSMDIKTIYNNTLDSTTFWTFGAEETQSGGGGEDTTPSRVLRLFEGFTVKFISGRVILHQKQ